MMEKKGFGEVASTLIMFIAVVGITIAVIVSFQNFVVESQDSFEKKQDLTTKKLQTSLTISNIFYNSTSNKLYTYIKNVGDTSVGTQGFDVFLDDEFKTSFIITKATNFSQEISLLAIQETGTIILNQSLTPGTHSIKIVTQSGVEVEKNFNT